METVLNNWLMQTLCIILSYVPPPLKLRPCGGIEMCALLLLLLFEFFFVGASLSRRRQDDHLTQVTAMSLYLSINLSVSLPPISLPGEVYNTHLPRHRLALYLAMWATSSTFDLTMVGSVLSTD